MDSRVIEVLREQPARGVSKGTVLPPPRVEVRNSLLVIRLSVLVGFFAGLFVAVGWGIKSAKEEDEGVECLRRSSRGGSTI